MRARALFVLTLVGAGAACAAAALPHPHATTTTSDAGPDGGDAEGATASRASSSDAGLDVAALAENLAPGMRQLVDLRDAGGYTLAPTDVDRCYRIAIVSTEIASATLTDDAGHVLATARGRSPAVGAKGPVCLRKGQRATLAVEGPILELIVWTSP